MHHVFETYEPWAGELRARERGSIVADRKGPTTAYAITSLQERCTLFVPPGTDGRLLSGLTGGPVAAVQPPPQDVVTVQPPANAPEAQ